MIPICWSELCPTETAIRPIMSRTSCIAATDDRTSASISAILVAMSRVAMMVRCARDLTSLATQMTTQIPLTRASLKTPKAAAVAGIIFSTLLIVVFWLFRLSVPADPKAPGAWLYTNRSYVELALNLVPFAGVAFFGASAFCGTGSAISKASSSRPFSSAAVFFSWRFCFPPPASLAL